MPRRILHVIPTLDRSGAEKQLTLLACGLPRSEFDVHVCALTRGGPLQDKLMQSGIPTTVIGKSFKADPRAWWKLRRHIARLKPDLVQTWLFAANAYGRSAAISANVRVLVASERCVDPWKAWHQLAIDRWLARRTETIVVNSSGVSEFYIRHGLPADKFVLIPNGAELPPPTGMIREALLQELHLPPNSRLVAAVGRLWPQKRVEDLIGVMDLVKRQRDDVHLLVVGDGPLRPRLERVRSDLHLDAHVHFLGHRADVPQLLPLCDMLCLASEYEGLPNVLMEAMAAGLPVIASDIPGNRDLVVPADTGYLVPLGNQPAFARMVEQILGSPPLAVRLGAAGRQRIVTEFSVQKMVDRFAGLYRRLLK